MPTPGSRRAFLRSSGLLALAATTGGLTGCAGLTSRVSGTSRGSSDTLTVQVYGTDTEAEAYQRLARRFEAARRGITVDVTHVPFSEASTAIDSGLASGTAPDVFRVDYPTMGVYSSTDQLLDVTDAVTELAGDTRTAFMRGVSFADRVYGVPQHVDTSAVIFRRDAIADAGVTVPTDPGDAWSWEEFGAVADTLRDASPDDRSAFAVNWQELGAFRWLTWLFMAGGNVYSPDLGRPEIDSAAGRRALEFTQSFFDRGWVPAASSTKAATYPDQLFTSGALAMLFAGNFLLPTFADTIDFEYAVTFQPRDRRRASELGGNALVATREAANPELAADYLVFMSEPRQMADFCTASALIPTRDSLLERDLDYAARPDLMRVYNDQVRTIEDRDVADVTAPAFADVNLALANELEQCFLEGRSVDDTLVALSEQIDQSTALNDEAAAS